MKLSQLTDKRLQTTLKALMNKPLPIKTAYKLKGLVKTVNDELAKYESLRQDIIGRLADRKDDGTIATDTTGNVLFTSENRAAFFKELKDLLEMDVDMPSIKLADLGTIDITAEDLFALDELIAE